MFMEFSCMYIDSPARSVTRRGGGRWESRRTDMLTLWTTDSNYPFPSPDWITSNASWAAEQLAIYYDNRTG